MRAILFPGQGSQFIGMGSDFYKKFDLVKKNFSLVDESLGFPLSNSILQKSILAFCADRGATYGGNEDARKQSFDFSLKLL